MQNFLRQAGMQPPPQIILYTYTVRLKYGLKLSILGPVAKCKIFFMFLAKYF